MMVVRTDVAQYLLKKIFAVNHEHNEHTIRATERNKTKTSNYVHMLLHSRKFCQSHKEQLSSKVLALPSFMLYIYKTLYNEELNTLCMLSARS